VDEMKTCQELDGYHQLAEEVIADAHRRSRVGSFRWEGPDNIKRTAVELLAGGMTATLVGYGASAWWGWGSSGSG
jgi:hypothetical protein